MPDSNTHNTTYDIRVVAGPTASGKTDFALALAQNIGGELINIDSRQVYKHLDIGTGKGEVFPAGEVGIFAGNYPVYKFTGGAQIHLISFLNPEEQFNIYDFRTLVYNLIPKIIRNGKVPILVGGSGLYLSAILHPEKYKLSGEKFNPDYRQKLESMSVGELQHLLIYYSKLTFEEMNPSDRANPRRLIRKLESLSSEGEIHGQIDMTLNLNARIHYKDISLDDLTLKINTRVTHMFEMGLVEEVRKLLEMGYTPKTPALQSIGYSQVLDHLAQPEKITLEDCIRNVQVAHRQYAKRQMTWFKKYLLPEQQAYGQDFRLLSFEL